MKLANNADLQKGPEKIVSERPSFVWDRSLTTIRDDGDESQLISMCDINLDNINTKEWNSLETFEMEQPPTKNTRNNMIKYPINDGKNKVKTTLKNFERYQKYISPIRDSQALNPIQNYYISRRKIEKQVSFFC